MASFILDNTSTQFTYGGGVWNTIASYVYFGGSTTWPDFTRTTNNSDTGIYGSLTFVFQGASFIPHSKPRDVHDQRTGTSVAFFGNTPTPPGSQWALFYVDGAPAVNLSFMDPSPPTVDWQWYQSPILPDGKHNITITHMPGVAVDYVVVTAGQNTQIFGQSIIVDDGDPSITYGGAWARNNNSYTDNFGPYRGVPYGNGVHQTTSVGATAMFSFTGTFIYG